MENNSKKDHIQDNNHCHCCHHRHRKIFSILLILVIIAIVGFWFSLIVGCNHMFWGRWPHHRYYYQFNNSLSSNYRNTSNSVILSGVVTSIKNNQITIIGNGTLDNINLNSNVIYQNGTKLAINDSVTIYGQYLNNHLVANTIEINP